MKDKPVYNLHAPPEMLEYELEQERLQEQKLKRGQSRQVLKEINLADLQIPSLPATTALLIQMCQDINCDFAKVGQVIQTDTGLSVRLLRLANSAHYAQVRQVNTVTRALTVIGLEEVKTLVLSYRLMNVIKQFASADFDFEAYWEKSLVMAVLAKEIARAMDSRRLDECFLVGLLQDIGVVILRTHKSGEYRKIADVAAVAPETPLIKMEQQIFGTDHARLGADACAAWEFPTVLVEAIRHHHTPPESVMLGNAASVLRAVAYAAALMPDFIVGNKPIQVLDDLHRHGIVQMADLEQVFSKAHHAFGSLAEFFGSYLPVDAQIADMMSCAVERLNDIGEAHLEIFQPPD